LSISLVGKFKLKVTVGARKNTATARDNKENKTTKENKEVVAIPPLDPAAQAWAVTRETKSQAVLEDFIRQFGKTVYGSMARARLKELKKTQVAAIPPPAHAMPSPPSAAMAPPAVGALLGAGGAAGPFDGIWEVTATNNRFCDLRTFVRTLEIKNNLILVHGRNPGQVGGDGTFRYEDHATKRRNFKRVSGKLTGASGSGSFHTVGGRCAGTVVLKRLESAQIQKKN
jgi:hypothetical protein